MLCSSALLSCKLTESGRVGKPSSQSRGLLCSRTKRIRRHRRVGKPSSLRRTVNSSTMVCIQKSDSLHRDALPHSHNMDGRNSQIDSNHYYHIASIGYWMECCNCSSILRSHRNKVRAERKNWLGADTCKLLCISFPLTRLSFPPDSISLFAFFELSGVYKQPSQN